MPLDDLIGELLNIHPKQKAIKKPAPEKFLPNPKPIKNQKFFPKRKFTPYSKGIKFIIRNGRP